MRIVHSRYIHVRLVEVYGGTRVESRVVRREVWTEWRAPREVRSVSCVYNNARRYRRCDARSSAVNMKTTRGNTPSRPYRTWRIVARALTLLRTRQQEGHRRLVGQDKWRYQKHTHIHRRDSAENSLPRNEHAPSVAAVAVFIVAENTGAAERQSRATRRDAANLSSSRDKRRWRPALVQIVDITSAAGRVAGSYSLENTAAPYADSCFCRSHAWDTKAWGGEVKRKREGTSRVGRDSPVGSGRWGRDTARGSKARARGRGKSTDRTGATTMREERA